MAMSAHFKEEFDSNLVDCCLPVISHVFEGGLCTQQLVEFVVNVTHPMHPHRLLYLAPALLTVDITAIISSYLLDEYVLQKTSTEQLTECDEVATDIKELAFCIYDGEIYPTQVNDILWAFVRPRTAHWFQFVTATDHFTLPFTCCQLLSQMVAPIIVIPAKTLIPVRKMLPFRFQGDDTNRKLEIASDVRVAIDALTSDCTVSFWCKLSSTVTKSLCLFFVQGANRSLLISLDANGLLNVHILPAPGTDYKATVAVDMKAFRSTFQHVFVRVDLANADFCGVFVNGAPMAVRKGVCSLKSYYLQCFAVFALLDFDCASDSLNPQFSDMQVGCVLSDVSVWSAQMPVEPFLRFVVPTDDKYLGKLVYGWSELSALPQSLYAKSIVSSKLKQQTFLTLDKSC